MYDGSQLHVRYTIQTVRGKTYTVEVVNIGGTIMGGKAKLKKECAAFIVSGNWRIQKRLPRLTKLAKKLGMMIATKG